jgi:hypothetical protein
MAGGQPWEHLVPSAAVSVINKMGIVERLRQSGR